MFLKWLSGVVLSKLFGDGLGADIAGRGTVYLADGIRKSIDKDDEHLTRVRLQPGETYTVIARPSATKAERKLAASQRSIRRRQLKATRPKRSQLTAARRLERAQRRLDRATPGSRRWEKRAAKEAKLGERFDRVSAPTRKQAKLNQQLEAADLLLDIERTRNMDRARRRGRPRRRHPRVRVYD